MEAYQSVFARKEIKYTLSERQLAALMPVLEAHMVPDAFAHSSISNLYYDTPDFRMVRRSLEKPDYKEKLRLRSYGLPEADSPVFPEIKKKARGIVYKRRVCMPYREALDYLFGRRPGGEGQIFRELDRMLRVYPALAPRVFLSYRRDSWEGRTDAGLRLTVDREILYRTQELELGQRPWGDGLLMPGQVLMEIKVPGAMPVWLAAALSDAGIFPASFSKYGRAYEALCRKSDRKEFKRYA